MLAVPLMVSPDAGAVMLMLGALRSRWAATKETPDIAIRALNPAIDLRYKGELTFILLWPRAGEERCRDVALHGHADHTPSDSKCSQLKTIGRGIPELCKDNAALTSPESNRSSGAVEFDRETRWVKG